MSCGVGPGLDLDPAWLWLWLWPAAAAPIRPLAWELPYAPEIGVEFPGGLVVKDPALSLLWLESLMWHEFDPYPGTSTCHGSAPPIPTRMHLCITCLS